MPCPGLQSLSLGMVIAVPYTTIDSVVDAIGLRILSVPWRGFCYVEIEEALVRDPAFSAFPAARVAIGHQAFRIAVRERRGSAAPVLRVVSGALVAALIVETDPLLGRGRHVGSRF
jgi:hypothetical protein